MNRTVYIVNFIIVIIETIAIAFIIEFSPFNFVMFSCLLIEIILIYRSYKNRDSSDVKKRRNNYFSVKI